MDVSNERILIFGDSLSHQNSDSAPYVQTVAPNLADSAPGAVLASILLGQGAQAAQTDARIGRSAVNFWNREDTASLIAADTAFQPTKVIVMLGTNDIGNNLDATQQAMTAIRDKYEGLGAEVWAIGPMTYNPPADNLNAGAPDVLAVMQGVFGADKTIDARPLAALEGRTSDGVHFTYAAALPTAQALAQALVATSSNASLVKRGLIIAGLGVAAVAIIGYTFKALKNRQLLGPIGMLLAPKVVGPALMAYDARRLSSAKDANPMDPFTALSKRERLALRQAFESSDKSYAAPTPIVNGLERKGLVLRTGHTHTPMEWGKVVSKNPVYTLTAKGREIAQEIVNKLYRNP